MCLKYVNGLNNHSPGPLISFLTVQFDKWRGHLHKREISLALCHLHKMKGLINRGCTEVLKNKRITRSLNADRALTLQTRTQSLLLSALWFMGRVDEFAVHQGKDGRR